MSRGFTGVEVRDAIFSMFVKNGGNCVTIAEIAAFTGRHPGTIRKAINVAPAGIDWTETYIRVNSTNYPGILIREQKVPAFQPSRSFLAERIQRLFERCNRLEGNVA